jgi:hypothetical protein
VQKLPVLLHGKRVLSTTYSSWSSPNSCAEAAHESYKYALLPVPTYKPRVLHMLVATGYNPSSGEPPPADINCIVTQKNCTENPENVKN